MPAVPPPSVLLTAIAWERFAPVLTPGMPEADWWLLDADGSVRPVRPGPGGVPTPLADLREVEVAWLSNDVFRSPVLPALGAHLRRAPALRWVQSGAAGTDGELFTDLLRRGVRLTTCHVTAIPIAEYVLGHVLRLYQQPERWAAAAARGQWRHHDFREVHGSTWLVVGLGAIGTEVARRARALGARVVGVRRHPRGDEPVDEMRRPGELAAAVAGADVVVLAAPGTPETHHLVDEPVLAATGPGTILVNVARGSLVDEAALEASLARGRPGHAVLDVAAAEPPPPDSFLWHHPRVTLTPHAAGGGTGRYRRAAEAFARNLARYRSGRPLDGEVRA